MQPITRFLLISVAAGGLSASSCSTNPQPGTSDTAAARATVTRLEAEARALAKADGCTTASQCRTAPIGERPCGGPRTYVPYCTASTDSAVLFRKLDELKVAEKRYNELTGMASTCEFRTPPAVALSGGSCRTSP